MPLVVDQRYSVFFVSIPHLSPKMAKNVPAFVISKGFENLLALAFQFGFIRYTGHHITATILKTLCLIIARQSSHVAKLKLSQRKPKQQTKNNLHMSLIDSTGARLIRCIPYVINNVDKKDAREVNVAKAGLLDGLDRNL